MAQYRLAVQTIQRAMGRSVVAAAAYRSGQCLVDGRLAMEFDFEGKSAVEHAEILAPANAPAAYRDRETLWNTVERAEGRKDAVPAREILLSLPHELNFEQRRELVQAFVAEHVVARGMIADIALHQPGKEGDDRNFHAHILVTTREVGPKGFGRKPEVWWSPKTVRDWREGWAAIQNQHLRRHLGPDAPQVSHLSLTARGVARDPTEHLGPSGTALERRGQASERGQTNREVRDRNAKLKDLRVDFQATAERIAKRSPEVSVDVSTLLAETQKVREKMVGERDRWAAERASLVAPKVPGVGAIERELTGEAARDQALAKRRLERVQGKVGSGRAKRLQLARWIRNPARMIWAKHAELNAIGRARSALRRADANLDMRRTWLSKPEGQAFVSARRSPGLEQAANIARQRRTLERKIKRVEVRIAAAGRTVNDLRMAQELGEKQLRVPAKSPDETRFIRDVGAPAREAVMRFPELARTSAIERLNKSLGRTIGRGFIPER